MKLARVVHLLVSVLLIAWSHQAIAGDTSLSEFVESVLQHSPEIKASHSALGEARESIRSIEGDYYPKISLQAVDSSGFPGSTGGLETSGLMNSPYRSGWAYGLSAQQNILSFGRTENAIKIKESLAAAKVSEVEIVKLQVEIKAVSLFYQCSLNRTLKSAWAEIHREAQLIENETSKFVATGQRTVTEKLLAQSQSEEALTHESSFESRYLESQRRLSILSGTNEMPSCSPLPQEAPKHALALKTAPSNPFVEQARALLHSADSEVQMARAEQHPLLNAVASFGQLESSRVVQPQNYSIGVSLIFPLFDGFKTKHEIDRSLAKKSTRELLVQAATEAEASRAAELDEEITGARVELEHLGREYKIAREALTIAKQRYFHFNGTLVDAREAFRNLERVRSNLELTRARYYTTTAIRALLP